MSDGTKARRPPRSPPSLSSPSPPPPPPPSSNGETLNPKMARKSLLNTTLLATILIILATYAFFNTFVYPSNPTLSKLESTFPLESRSSYLLSTDSQENFASFPGKSAPVKVYMYDLPRKFTYGVVENYSRARGSTSIPDDTVISFPGQQHSAEWYLFKDMVSDNHDRVGSPVIRVSDPEEADLFYVPFFSSLSLVVNPIRNAASVTDGSSPVAYSDDEMQEALIEWLEGQVYWKRNNGWDHVIICQDPNALYKLIDRVKNSVLLVSDFGRLRPGQGSLVKDVILPYSHRIRAYTGDVGVENRSTLLFFMGNRYRKEGGKIRDLLFQLLETEEDVIIKHGSQSRESRRMASQGMHSSKFCLHPAGDTPSACRLFDAIVSLCVPVIVSDRIELPFEDVIDYRRIAIFVSSASALKPGFLVNMLRTVPAEKILEYQQEMRVVKRYFDYADPNGTVNEIWRQVSQKLPLIKLMINRDKRLIKRDLIESDCSCICSNQTGTVTTL